MHSVPKSREEQLHAIRHWTSDDSWYKPPLCGLVVKLSRFVMQRLNSVEFVNRERWDAVLEDRTRGILSFSNHVSLFDDPLLISNLGTTRYREVRWIAADHKNFFGTKFKGLVYSAGKCVPIIRGAGLDQPGFEFLIERLRANDWVHIFPEGGRTREAQGRLRVPFKTGIGRLMADARPIMIPFYHYGMHEVLPIGKALPRSGQNVVVHFGHPTDLTPDWWAKHVDEQSTPAEQWKTLTQWSQSELESLQTRVLDSLSVQSR